MVIRLFRLKYIPLGISSSCKFSAFRPCVPLTRMMPSEAHFRWKNEAAVFDFSFYLDHKELGVSRIFNFSRRITETVGEFQNRVRTNLDKTLSKKRKKKKKQVAAGEAEGDDSFIAIDFCVGDTTVSADANCKDVMHQGGVIMQLLGLQYAVQVNAPSVMGFALPDTLLAGFPMYPTKLELEFAEKQHCRFRWYKSAGTLKLDLPKALESVGWLDAGADFCFTPGTEDVGCHVKLVCVPVAGEREGPPTEVVSRAAVEAGPGICPFDTRHAFTSKYLEGNNSFRVVSYNLLADLYTDSEYSRTVLFPYCPPYALAIDYRKQLFLKELIGYHADVMCLQEVDGKVFDQDLQPTLASRGYQGVYSKKGGQVTEGLACIFRSDRFELLESLTIHLSEEIPTNPIFEHLHSAVQQNEALKTRLLERGTILQCVVLRHRESGRVLVVGSTHLYFHPDADHVRLLQAAACLRFLETTLERWRAKVPRVSLLFCGDFNSTPEFGVYRLMTEKHIPEDYLDWTSKEEEAVQGLSLSHKLQLASACGTPKYTNFTVGFADCLDYIFYQRDELQVTQVVPLPDEEELRQYTAIPSVVLPSDHLALVADLGFSA